jgi:hypothetical protein
MVLPGSPGKLRARVSNRLTDRISMTNSTCTGMLKMSASPSSSIEVQRQKLQQRINELRVAHQELRIVKTAAVVTTAPLSSSNPEVARTTTTAVSDCYDKVYIQLSSGSVAILTDRSVAEARVSRQLHHHTRLLDELEANPHEK